MLEYSLKQSDLLNEKGINFIITGSQASNKYSQRVLKEYKRAKDLNEFIYVYEKEDKKIALIANIEDSVDEKNYFNALTLYFNNIYAVYGRRINVYLPSVTNFYNLACAAERFCEKNLAYNYIIHFFCEEESFTILSQQFESLNTLFENQKLEISKFLYDSFSCSVCKNFTYSPYILNCCNLVYCQACIYRNKKCKICPNKIEAEEQTKIHRIFKRGPFYCFCGEKIKYSDRECHFKICEIPWYKCWLCNLPLVYKNSLEHFKNDHLWSLMNEDLF